MTAYADYQRSKGSTPSVLIPQYDAEVKHRLGRSDIEVAERILCQGKALVRAIESLETIEPTGPIERVQAWFLLQAYRRRLRAIIKTAPGWMAEEILSASERIADDRPVHWISTN